jgi:quercetin dioxygenase-like cupin family protein
MSRRLVLVLAVLVLGTFLSSPAAVAQQDQPAGSVALKAVAETKVAALPAGRPGLYWRLENFPSLAQAQAAAGPSGLAAESTGRAWLFTLGPKGGASAGGTRVAEVGPLAAVVAPQYLLRINEGSGPPGSITVVHTHPGVETFYVLAGELCIRTPDGVTRVPAGRANPGLHAGTPMQVSSCGSTDGRWLVMFVVDATKPFSSPTMFP